MHDSMDFLIPIFVIQDEGMADSAVDAALRCLTTACRQRRQKSLAIMYPLPVSF